MTLKQRVEALLESDQLYRDSDKYLLLEIWRQEGLELTEEQRSAFLRASTAESITRARRNLQWKYPASQEIADARRNESTRMKHVYSPHRAIAWLDEDEVIDV